MPERKIAMTQANLRLVDGTFRDGFYVHCLGHSFGGRFLTATIKAAMGITAPA
jgi:hypothetical protein